MTLRTCIEVLRENQMCGTNKVCKQLFFLVWATLFSVHLILYIDPSDGAIQGLQGHTFV